MPVAVLKRVPRIFASSQVGPRYRGAHFGIGLKRPAPSTTHWRDVRVLPSA